MNKKSLESWSPWILLVLSILVWEGLCRAFNVSEFVFPSPSRIAQQTLVVWFGIGIGPAILTAFLISFFPIMVNIATGLATLEPELEDVLRVLGAKRWDVLVKVGLPRSMPYFYGSLKVAITLAFVGTTVSEMTASNEGIGYLLISAGSAMQMGLAFSGLVVVGAMAMAMYELFSAIEKRTTGWAHRGSQGE
jgi:NitT/TauT family transport system permease protein